MHTLTPEELPALPQGDLRLRDSDIAQGLPASTELARVAYAAADHPGVRMARIAVRPAWVGVLDFRPRFPGDSTATEFTHPGTGVMAEYVFMCHRTRRTFVAGH